jgi:stress response protein SCP2
MSATFNVKFRYVNSSNSKCTTTVQLNVREGTGESAIIAELKRRNPNYRDIVILNCRQVS